MDAVEPKGNGRTNRKVKIVPANVGAKAHYLFDPKPDINASEVAE